MMTLDRFEEGLDCWGGTLDRWPVADRRAAEALLAASALARARHALMREIETALAMPRVETPSATRFAAVATCHPQARPAPPALRRAGWSAAAAAALVLGVFVGHAGLGAVHEDAPDQLLASALDLSTGSADVD